nr:spondin domain-containing protein [Nitrosomonas nitrosa]
MRKSNFVAAIIAFAFAAGPNSHTAVAFAAGADGESKISVLIESVSAADTLKLRDGRAISAHISPGMYVVLSDGSAAFEPGKPASQALEQQAEDGNPRELVAMLKMRPGVRVVGTFMPGEPFTVTVRPGDRLVFTSMFVQSNDLFYTPHPQGIALFDGAGRPVTGDLTGVIQLWDAGTEVNEAPGLGPNQAPRQIGPNTGPTEGGIVRPVNDGFSYPATREVIRVTFTAE